MDGSDTPPPAAALAHLESLRALAAHFRAEFRGAVDAVRRDEAAAWLAVWDDVRAGVVRDLGCAAAEPSQTVLRIQRAADAYFEAYGRPERFVALPAVEGVLQRYAVRLARWAADAPPPDAPEPEAPPEAASAPLVDALLADPRLAGWPLRGDADPSPDAGAFVWYPPANPYSTDQPFGRLATDGWTGFRPAQVLLALAGAAETLRCGWGDPAAAAAAAGCAGPREWLRYRDGWLARRGRWVDVERVAVAVCGYPPAPAPPAPGLAAWREPLRRTEAALAVLLDGPLCPPFVRQARAEWLRRECGCDPDAGWLGVRFPPAFTALIADVLAGVVEADGATDARVRWDPAVLAAAHAAAAPEPEQRYSLWVLHGRADPPAPAACTAGWDDAALAAAAAAGWVWTPALAAHWTARRRNAPPPGAPSNPAAPPLPPPSHPERRG